MINILSDRANVGFALVNATFLSCGIDVSNILIIYEMGPTLKSYVPGRGLNSVTSFTKGNQYYIYSVINFDLPAVTTSLTPFNWFDGKTMEFHGDSVMGGVGTSDTTNRRWPRLFCTATGGVESNHAVGGQALQLEAANCEYATSFDRTTIATKTISHKYLFIAYGINDINLNNSEMTPSFFARDLQLAINHAISVKGWAASEIVLVTPYYYTNTSPLVSLCGVSVAASQQRVADYVNAVITVSKTNHCILGDVYTAMKNLSGVNGMIPDGIHPNDKLSQFITNFFVTLNYSPQ